MTNTALVDPLPSWTEGKVKCAIIEFVEQVTNENSPHFVAEEARIATFDHDGTLWVEKPLLAQLAFYKCQLLDAGDTVKVNSNQGIFVRIKKLFIDCFDILRFLLAYLHLGLTTEQYRTAVSEWINQALHPRYQRKYTDLTYLPMKELLTYFSRNGFSNYIVSGGTANFIRPWSEDIYNISADRIIGSSTRTRLSIKEGQFSIKVEPIPFSFEYCSGKVLGIERRLAKQPIAAFGNSLGDADMLRWTRTTVHSLCVLIHHTDDVREYKYNPDPFYHLGKSTLSYAAEENWQVVDMKNDWLQLFEFDDQLVRKNGA